MTDIVPTLQTRPPPTEKEVKDKHKREIQKSINCARIATIVSFDPGEAGVRAATATVQIAQLQVTSISDDGTQTTAPFPPIEKVPVIFPCGGGYNLTFPIAQNDECLLVFNDRQIDNWLQSGAGQPPTIGRVHDLTDAVAYVGLRSNPRALGGISTTATELRSDNYTGPNGAGEIISMSPGSILIVADDVKIHGRNRAEIDAHGTGHVMTPGNIDTRADTGSVGPSNPPGPL